MKEIDVLPDDVLLEIFNFYTDDPLDEGNPLDEGKPRLLAESKKETEAWQLLVHVCRRWRNIVFGSPCRLDLKLFCTLKTPVKDSLEVWPALPLIIEDRIEISSDMDNIIAALEQSNRVCKVYLMELADCQLEKVLAAMQVPFPELYHLQLSSHGETDTTSVIPDSFLGGSAPDLEFFELHHIPYPRLTKLLSSATHLVHLGLNTIPPFLGYISPEAMVTLLSALFSLETLILYLEFRSPVSPPHWEGRSLSPPKRSILPSLEKVDFFGFTEYLEELMTRIDTPQLLEMEIELISEFDFDCPRLVEFIHRTPTIRARDKANVQFHDDSARLSIPLQACSRTLDIGVSCPPARDRRLSSVVRICNSFLPPPPTVEDLYIERQYSSLVWINDVIEITLWLQLLRPFSAVKNLYLSKEFAPVIATALQEIIGSRMTEVLPDLQNIFVEGLEPSGLFEETIGQFLYARQLSDHPVAISDWEKP